MSISKYDPGLYCSVLIPGSFVSIPNHHDLAVLDLTKSGTTITVCIRVGTNFKNEDDVDVKPLGYLSTVEFKRLSKMLPRQLDDNTYTVRTLPMEWETVDFIVRLYRLENLTIEAWYEFKDSVTEDDIPYVNEAIKLVLGDEWSIDNVIDYKENLDEV